MDLEKLVIEQTQSTPYILFSGEDQRFMIKGESFPENAAKFYAPVLEWLKKYVEALCMEQMVLEFEIVYFNSSTSKVFMTILDLLQVQVELGKRISVLWRCDEENETAIECGEEFKEDLDKLPFEIVLI